VEATDHDFSSTQRLNQLARQPGSAAHSSAEQQWLRQRLFGVPDSRWRVAVRLLRLRFSLALLAPVLCGALLAWWQLPGIDAAIWPLFLLLLLGSAVTVVGLNLLHEYHDYEQAHKSTDIKFSQTVFATGYHLLATEKVPALMVKRVGYGLIFLGFCCYLGLVQQLGWPLMFFYTVSLLLAYTYSAPPVSYSYAGWGLGEIGLFLGYGFLPLLGSYYIIGQTLTPVALFTSIPFGIAAILLFGNYNFIHYRRDWLMRKRTLVVTAGPMRMLGVNAILTLLIYAAVLSIVSVAHLPVIVLITLAALPLAMRIYGQLRGDEMGLEEGFLLYRATVSGILWTTLLFCLALLADKLI